MLGVNVKNAIVGRLMEIVTTESLTVQTKNGPVEDEVIADKNSLTAAKSLGGLHVKFLKNRNDDSVGVMLNVKDQNAILVRLRQILAKQTVTVQTKNGSVEDEVIADMNSIAAAKFMIGIQAKSQKQKKENADIVRLNDDDEKAIVDRLMQILSKRSVIVQTKNGPVEDRVIANKNAMTSANLLMKLPGTAGSSTSPATSGSSASPATGGSSASHEGFKIGKPLARRETENEPGTAGSCAAHDGFKIGKSIARRETENETAPPFERVA